MIPLALTLLAALVAAPSFAGAEILFGVDEAFDELIRIDPSTGEAAVIGPVGGNISSLATDPRGVLFGTDTSSGDLVVLSTLTGASKSVGALGVGEVTGLAFAPDSTLFGAEAGAGQLVTIDPMTGAATRIGPLGFALVTGLAFDAAGTLYGVDSGTDELLTIDPTTGAAVVVGPTVIRGITGLEFDPSGALLGVSRITDELLSVDTSTGEATAVGPLGLGDRWVGGLSFAPEAEYAVRTGYVIPNDRTLDPTKVTDLQDYLRRIQPWYGENLERQGFVERTFTYETESDGRTPRVNVVHAADDAAYLLAEDAGYAVGVSIARLRAAMTEAGFPGLEGETWIVIGEIHMQFPDGSKEAGPFRGGGTDRAGHAWLGGGLLFRITRPFLVDLSSYDGLIFERFGPFPLVYPISFPGEGPTVSSIADAAQFGIAHELGHGFSLPHQDHNQARSLMGRNSFRGATFPDLFPDEDLGLASGSALVLHYSRFFNRDVSFDDQVRPDLTIHTAPGFVDPVDGHLEIRFSASDESGIVAAFLRTQTHYREWVAIPLPGDTETTLTMRTPFYAPDVSERYFVLVVDAQGNQQERSVELTVNPGFNRAPTPKVILGNAALRVGSVLAPSVAEEVLFGSEGDWTATTVEWDRDGDGTFDTPPTTTKDASWSYADPGVYQVIARLTDPDGAVTLSSPIGVRVSPEPCDVDGNDHVDHIDIEAIFGSRGDYTGNARDPRDYDTDGIVTVLDSRGCVLECTRPHCEALPEPGSALLLASGAGLLLWLAKLRQRRRTAEEEAS